MPSRASTEHKNQARRAIALAIVIAGSQGELARKITEWLAEAGDDEGMTKVGVNWWLQQGSLVKERYWAAIENVTGFAVTRRYLRPDIFGQVDPLMLERAAELSGRWEKAA